MKEVEILQNYYESFIAQKDPKAFLVGLVDYADFISHNDKCQKIIEGVKKMKDELFQEKDALEKQVNGEVEMSKKESDLARELLGLQEHAPRESRELPEKSKDEVYFDRLFHSKTHPELLELEKKIRREQKTEIWGVWDQLSSICSEPQSYRGVDMSNCKIQTEKMQRFLFKKLSETADDQDERESTNTPSESVVETILLVADNEKAAYIKNIWLVFNNDFHRKVKFSAKGKSSLSGDSYMRTLYEIVNYRDSAGGSQGYNRTKENGINSKIFERKGIKGVYKQTTIVTKKKDGNGHEVFELEKGIKISCKPISRLNKELAAYFPKA